MRHRILDTMLSIAHVRSIPEILFNATTTFFAFMAGYFNLIVLDNINLFMSVFIVCLGDWLFGTLNAIVSKTFETRKALRLVWYLTGYWVIVFIVLTIEKAHTAAFFLSEAVILPIIVFQLISLLKNASLLGIIPQGLLLKLLTNIDSYKDQALSEIKSTADETGTGATN